ncbi:ABC transporter permease [Streptomyces sp. NPDC048057]|uniref:ABC transporter permease n=1 Tax=Streptomyces sp. NPDC048057 TaxID=3155628 RepID=UPI0033F686AB
MATTTDATRTGRGAGAAESTARSTTAGRLTALGRAELTLLVRNRAMLFVALLMPVMMVAAVQGWSKQLDYEKTAMSVAEASVTAGIGFVLLFVVHANLVSAYVARREELVLKRLRTGEVSDREILVGTALPAGALAVAQCVLIAAVSLVAFDVSAPERPDLVVAGIVLGLVLMVALAAVVSVGTRTVESAQLTTLPLLTVSLLGSGLFVPLELLPEKVASVCELLPLTGVMTLVRSGWTGGGDAKDLVGAAVTALAWIVVSVFAVQRWFRWEPRR